MSALDRQPDAAGRAALALYGSMALAVRTHVAIRWWTAPFPRVAAALPRSGRVLEIGCGHGLFAAYAALEAPGREVVGVDIDADKITHARAASEQTTADLHFEVAESGAVPTGPWDAVVFVDVLYLLPADEQRRLITEAVATLGPEGVLVIKEMGASPAWKVRWNQVQETLSVRVLRITQGSSFDFVAPATTTTWLESLGLAVEEQRLDRHRVHPHHLLIGRRAH